MIRVLPSGRKDFYYRYRFKRRDYTKKLGRFQQRPADGGLTLREERRKAAERQADLASRRGSFAQLLAAYVDRLRHRGAVSSRSVEALCARAE
jgi:hypothetical protein